MQLVYISDLKYIFLFKDTVGMASIYVVIVLIIRTVRLCKVSNCLLHDFRLMHNREFLKYYAERKFSFC